MSLVQQGAAQVDRHLELLEGPTLAEDVLDGLTRPFKELPPKHLYDARGSELFELICELPEYYPTRTESAILRDCAADAIARSRACELVELGAGYATKTPVLLDAMRDAGTLVRYMPFDVSPSTVVASARRLVQEYPGLEVQGVIGDFDRHLGRLPAAEIPRLVAFLGSTIGNFPPGSRRRFLRSVARILGGDGHLLLGTDLVKDPRVLEAAYNDSAGLTAEFNRNMLCVLNRELEADFDVERFDHIAFFDREWEWIEMRLRAREAQTVRVRGVDLTVGFGAGEELRTEISAKFTPERLDADMAAAGLRRVGWYTDADDLFAVSLWRQA